MEKTHEFRICELAGIPTLIRSLPFKLFPSHNIDQILLCAYIGGQIQNKQNKNVTPKMEIALENHITKRYQSGQHD